MGFFQSIFNKDKGGIKKEVVTPKNTKITTQDTPPPNPQVQQPLTTVMDPINSNSSLQIIASSPPTSPQPQHSSVNSSTISSTTTPNTTKTPTPPLSQRTSNETTRRFQLNEDGTHIHYLIQPTPAANRITASLNGLLGIANKSLRLKPPHQWNNYLQPTSTTEKRAAQNLEDIQKERIALNTRLHRKPEEVKETLAEKWGHCQETIGKGTSGVVRVAHKQLSDGTERLYAVKVGIYLIFFFL